jgi:hypothetical protein
MEIWKWTLFYFLDSSEYEMAELKCHTRMKKHHPHFILAAFLSKHFHLQEFYVLLRGINNLCRYFSCIALTLCSVSKPLTKLFVDHITMYGCPEQEIRKVNSVRLTLEDSACPILKVENEKWTTPIDVSR